MAAPIIPTAKNRASAPNIAMMYEVNTIFFFITEGPYNSWQRVGTMVRLVKFPWIAGMYIKKYNIDVRASAFGHICKLYVIYLSS